MEHFSIITFNIRLSTFVKFVEFLKSSAVKQASKYFLIFYPEAMLKLCLSININKITLSLCMYNFFQFIDDI